MEINLARILNRFNKPEMLDVIRQLQLYDHRDGVDLQRTSKAKICSFIANKFKDSADLKDIAARLETLFLQSHETTRMWSIYHLRRKKTLTVLAAALCTFLTEDLKVICDNIDVSVNELESAFWIHILIRDAGKNNTYYAVHYPGTSFMGVTGISAKYSESILWALTKHLGFCSIEGTQLSDRNLHSILQLAYDSDTRDVATSTTRNFAKRTTRFSDVGVEIQSSLIVDEDREVHKMMKNYIMTKLGGNESQPDLRKLSYNMETPFLGEDYADQINFKCDGVFHCQMIFEGPSVTEGFQQLVSTGYAEFPLPEYMSNVRNFGKTNLLIRSII